ncbi:hypothetical protein G6F24_013877 [Rhizopus arrhizus]|nr:hypothetical protein G6F24_013877 [Rhizopus arrhizus]
MNTNNGWKLVPVWPTEEMLTAARQAPIPTLMVDSYSAEQNLGNGARYRAMLAAAPESPPLTVTVDPDPRGVSVGVYQGSSCVYHGAHPIPAGSEQERDWELSCDACNGARFNSDTLSIQMRGKNAGELLSMEVDDAIGYFAAHPKIHRPLQLMQDVGLGYLTLGQPSPTLSGGEAQRIKLVTELSKARLTDGLIKTGRASRIPHTLYVLDEPTVGLSMADVEKLIHVLHRLPTGYWTWAPKAARAAASWLPKAHRHM